MRRVAGGQGGGMRVVWAPVVIGTGRRMGSSGTGRIRIWRCESVAALVGERGWDTFGRTRLSLAAGRSRSRVSLPARMSITVWQRSGVEQDCLLDVKLAETGSNRAVTLTSPRRAR